MVATIWVDYVDRAGQRSWREVVPVRTVYGPTGRSDGQPRWCLVVNTPQGERVLLMSSIKGVLAADPALTAQMHVWAWQGQWYVLRHGSDVPLHSCATEQGARDWIHGYTGAPPCQQNIHGS